MSQADDPEISDIFPDWEDMTPEERAAYECCLEDHEFPDDEEEQDQ